MSRSIPNFGALLAPYIAQVPESARPRFLAMLERGAAERYRMWAEALPQQASGLLACAAREDEIADRIEQLFHIDEAMVLVLQAPLPAARDTYYAIFDGLDAFDQLAIQADAERQGATAWRGIAAGISDPLIRVELEQCSLLEERSADFLDALIVGSHP